MENLNLKDGSKLLFSLNKGFNKNKIKFKVHRKF
jgi:hypothetical protein